MKNTLDVMNRRVDVVEEKISESEIEDKIKEWEKII